MWPCAHCRIGGNKNLWQEIHFNISFRLPTLKLTDVFRMLLSFNIPLVSFSSMYEPPDWPKISKKAYVHFHFLSREQLYINPTMLGIFDDIYLTLNRRNHYSHVMHTYSCWLLMWRHYWKLGIALVVTFLSQTSWKLKIKMKKWYFYCFSLISIKS